MSDDTKRRTNRPSKRPQRHDARAEPDSVRLPEPEAVVTRTRRASSPPDVRNRPTARIARPQPLPAAERLTQPDLVPVRPRLGSLPEAGMRGGDADASVVVLRKQLAAVQQELAQTKQRLTKEQEERVEETDRLSDMLTRVTRLEANLRSAEERAGKAAAADAVGREKAEKADAELRAANEALANAERKAAKDLEQLAKLTAELEAERTTSQWLRTAGEQTTRELATFRARDRDVEAAAESLRHETSAHAQSVAELTRTRLELEESKAERLALETKHQATLGQAREEHAQKTEHAAKDADEQIRAMAERLVQATGEVEALRTERDALSRSLAEAHARAATAAEHMVPMGEMLSTLKRSLDGLDRSEAQITSLRQETHVLRKAVADQATALELLLTPLTPPDGPSGSSV